MAVVVWRGAIVQKLVEAAAADGARVAAVRLFEDAQQRVPLDDGALRDSAAVTTDGETAVVSYDTPYAVRLHESPQYDFQGQGESKWLENAVARREPHVAEDMAAPLRKVMMLP